MPALRRGQPHRLAGCTDGGAEPGESAVDALQQVLLTYAHGQRIDCRLLELVSLIDHQMLMRWQHCAAPKGIGEKQGVVGDDQVSILRRSAAVPIETLLGLVIFTMRGETIIGSGCRSHPEQLLEAVELDL